MRWLRLPPPRWTMALSITVASVAAAPLVLQLATAALSSRRGAHLDALLLPLLASTGLLTLILARGLMRSTSRATHLRLCLFGAPALGALNVGLTLGLAALFRGQPANTLAVLVVGSLFGLFVGGPIGFAFGLAFLFPSEARRRATAHGSQAAAAHTLALCGLWLAAVGLLVSAFFPWGSIPIAVGGVFVVLGGASLARRARWLARVDRGEVDGYHLAPRGGDEAAPPFLAFAPYRCDRALMREERHPDPYRRSPRGRVIAVV